MVVTRIIAAALLAGWASAGAAQEYQHLVGEVFEGEFPIPGWEEVGGGLFAAPVWHYDYAQSDGSHLIVVLWEMPRGPGATYATFQVTDVAPLGRLPEGYDVVYDCQGPTQDITHSFIGYARIDEAAELWTDLSAAWAVDHFTGRIAEVAPDGVTCPNLGWGL